MRKRDSGAHPGTPRAGRRLPPEERRAQILTASLPRFARQGYVATGTRDLARAAGITEPILYRHFGDKRGLFLAVLEQAGARLTAALEAALPARAEAAARLRSLAEALPALLTAHRDDLRVLNAASVVGEDAEIRAAASLAARRIGQALSGAFRGTGLRRGVRAETAGFLLLEVGLGAATLRPLAIPEMEGEDYVGRVVDALLRGIVG